MITTLVIAACGTGLALLKAYFPNLFNYVLWGLVGSALLAIIIVPFILWGRLPKRLPEIKAENIEIYVRTWLDNFQVNVKRVEEPNAFFAFATSGDSGMNIAVTRPKKADKYIALHSRIQISAEDKVFYDALKDVEKNIFGANLTVELSRSGVGYTMDLEGNSIVLVRRVPITPTLNEESFMQAFDELDNAVVGIHRVLVLRLIEMKSRNQQITDAEAAHRELTD